MNLTFLASNCLLPLLSQNKAHARSQSYQQILDASLPHRTFLLALALLLYTAVEASDLTPCSWALALHLQKYKSLQILHHLLLQKSHFHRHTSFEIRLQQVHPTCFSFLVRTWSSFQLGKYHLLFLLWMSARFHLKSDFLLDPKVLHKSMHPPVRLHEIY